MLTPLLLAVSQEMERVVRLVTASGSKGGIVVDETPESGAEVGALGVVFSPASATVMVTVARRMSEVVPQLDVVQKSSMSVHCKADTR